MNFRKAKSQPLAWLGKRCAGGSACFCLSVGAAPASGLRWTTQEGAFNTRRFRLLPSGSCTCLQARLSSAEPPWTWLRRLRTVGHLKSSLGKRVSIGCAPHPFHWRNCVLFLVGAPRATPDKTHILECQPLGYSAASCQDPGTASTRSIRLPEHPCPNHDNVRVPRAYGCQCAHAQTMITFVFQEHTVANAPMPKP